MYLSLFLDVSPDSYRDETWDIRLYKVTKFVIEAPNFKHQIPNKIQTSKNKIQKYNAAYSKEN